jgi:hypothetical protein
VHFDEAKVPKQVHMWYDKPNGFFTTTDYFNTYLHYIIDPAWEFAISSAGSYEDVIGIQMQRNMTKFDDLPGPADDAEMEMLLKHTATRLWRIENMQNSLDAFMHDELEPPDAELEKLVPEVRKVFERRPYFAKALLGMKSDLQIVRKLRENFLAHHNKSVTYHVLQGHEQPPMEADIEKDEWIGREFALQKPKLKQRTYHLSLKDDETTFIKRKAVVYAEVKRELELNKAYEKYVHDQVRKKKASEEEARAELKEMVDHENEEAMGRIRMAEVRVETFEYWCAGQEVLRKPWTRYGYLTMDEMWEEMDADSSDDLDATELEMFMLEKGKPYFDEVDWYVHKYNFTKELENIYEDWKEHEAVEEELVNREGDVEEETRSFFEKADKDNNGLVNNTEFIQYLVDDFNGANLGERGVHIGIRLKNERIEELNQETWRAEKMYDLIDADDQSGQLHEMVNYLVNEYNDGNNPFWHLHWDNWTVTVDGEWVEKPEEEKQMRHHDLFGFFDVYVGDPKDGHKGADGRVSLDEAYAAIELREWLPKSIKHIFSKKGQTFHNGGRLNLFHEFWDQADWDRDGAVDRTEYLCVEYPEATQIFNYEMCRQKWMAVPQHVKDDIERYQQELEKHSFDLDDMPHLKEQMREAGDPRLLVHEQHKEWMKQEL